jgi:hypothetical protein
VTANVYPDKYRGVSVTHLDVPLDEPALRAYFVGRSAYFKTRYAVVSAPQGTAIVRVHTDADASTTDAELFHPIHDITLLAGPQDTAVVHAPEIDTGIASQLARAARELAPGAKAVVVHGRYEHVSFIIDPQPIRLVVREVVPPHPAKLVDQAARVIDIREDLPPIELVPEIVDLATLAAAHPADHYLLPCRGSGFEPGSADVHYLDEHPPEGDWLLIGCTRSQQIHREFYGRDAPQVSFCPRTRPESELLTLTKCCLQDDELVVGDHSVSVPWGSSLARVGEALDRLVDLASSRSIV